MPPQVAPWPHLINKALGRGVRDPVEQFLHSGDADQEDGPHGGGQRHQQVARRQQQLVLDLKGAGGEDTSARCTAEGPA